MRRLDVDVASDFFEGAEDLKFSWMHRGVLLSKGEIVENILEAIKGMIEDGDITINDGAPFEALYVASMDVLVADAGFGAGAVARHALTVFGLELGRTRPDTSSIVLEQMVRAVFDTNGPVSILAVWVILPRVGDGIV